MVPVLFATVLGCDKKPTTDREKIGYAIGQQLGGNLKMQKIDLDPKMLAQSVDDALKGNPSKLTEKEMQEVFKKLTEQRMAEQKKMMEENEKLAKENVTKAEEFLAQNKTKSGVKTTESGLQYEIVKDGEGEQPKDTSRVRVHYTGTLIDGTEFDSSVKRGEPAEFAVGGVIPGWTEALKMMKKGAKWKLYVPPKLGYGERNAGKIPPNSVLIFDVELLDILKN